MQDYRHILIAVNDARGPLDEGLRLAFEERSWVTVLRVVPPYRGDIDLTGVRDIGEAVSSERDRRFLELRDIVYDAEVPGRVRVEEGDIAGTIVDVASEEKCDLIVMGSRKEAGFLSRLLGGNVVDKVTSRACCPVMVVDTRKGAKAATPPLAGEEPVPAY